LISWGKSPRSVDLGSVDQSTISGPEIPKDPITVLEKDLGVPATGSFVGNGDFVGRGPSDDQGLVVFQSENVGPTVSLADNQVGGLVVWLHRAKAEIN
jgi:hypothetical protein